jgi:sugar phosphate permease
MRQWRIQVFGACWLLYAGYYLCRKNFSVVMPMMTVGTLELAHLVFAYSLMYSLGQLVAGNLADRFGGRWIAALGALVSIAVNVGMAYESSYLLLLGLQAMNGLSQGFGWSAILKLLGSWFRRHERGVVLSWWGTSYVLGGFLATGFATYVATSLPLFESLGYRKAFLLPAILLGCVTAVFWRFTRERDLEESGAPQSKEDMGGWLEVLKLPEVQVISLMYFLLKTTRYSLLYWLPFYLVQGLGYAKDVAGYSSSVFELAGAVGPLVAGYSSDRFCGSRRHPVGVVMLLLLAGCFLMHPWLSRLGTGGVLLSIGLMGVFIYGTDLLMGGAAAMEAVPQHLSARATGTVNCIGSMGQLVSSYVVAVFVKYFGWDNLFYFFVACALAAAGALLGRMAFQKKKKLALATTA